MKLRFYQGYEGLNKYGLHRKNYFMAKMSLDDCQRFQELSQMHMELSTAGEDNLFSYAFSLGMLLTMEVMKEKHGIFND